MAYKDNLIDLSTYRISKAMPHDQLRLEDMQSYKLIEDSGVLSGEIKQGYTVDDLRKQNKKRKDSKKENL